MFKCKCKCGKVEFNLPHPPNVINRCFCSTCSSLSGDNSMTFCKIQNQSRVHIIGESKYLILSNNKDYKIDLSNISILRSSSFAHRGFCKDCLTPIYMRYDNLFSLWVNINIFDFPHSFTSDLTYFHTGSLIIKVDDVFTS